MKKLLVFLFFISYNSYSQSWNYSSGNNSFDGNFKTSSVEGYGKRSPYNNPTLVINNFNNGNINLYISGAGYFPESSERNSLWIFDNEPGVIYKSLETSSSKNSDIIFFHSFIHPETKLSMSKYEIIEKLTKSNKVEVRVSTDYSSNDLSFSLSGSTKALNYVIGEITIKALSNNSKIKRQNDLIELKKKNIELKKKNIEKEKRKNQEQNKKSELENKINSFKEILTYQSIKTYDKATIIGLIRNDLTWNDYKDINKYDSLIFEPIVNDTVFNGDIRLFYHLDDFPNKLKIQRAYSSSSQNYYRDKWGINDDSPLYEEAQKIIDINKEKIRIQKEEKEKEIKIQKDRILDLLSKLKDNNIIEFFAINVLLEQRDRNSLCIYPNGTSKICGFFELSKIKDLKITFKDTKNKFILNADLKIEFNDNSYVSKRNIKLTENGIMITKDYLKGLDKTLYQQF